MSRTSGGGGSLERFVKERRPSWAQLEALLANGRSLTAADWSSVAVAYRLVCADLARAEALGPGEELRQYLAALVARAHHRLYQDGRTRRWSLSVLLRQEFPAELRRSWRWLVLATTLFGAAFAYGGVGAWQSALFAESVLSPQELDQIEAAYQAPTGRADTGEDVRMAGYYVEHNVGIAFRCVATGVLGGLGSAFFLVYNGLVIGTAFGTLFRAGVGGNLVEFAAGHAAWELTGIIVAGTGGLCLGAAVVDTGGTSRWASVRRVAPRVLRLTIGAMTLLLVAAAIEGFWSASPLPSWAKLVFALVQWLLVFGWLGWGAKSAPASAPEGRR